MSLIKDVFTDDWLNRLGKAVQATDFKKVVQGGTGRSWRLNNGSAGLRLSLTVIYRLTLSRRRRTSKRLPRTFRDYRDRLSGLYRNLGDGATGTGQC